MPAMAIFATSITVLVMALGCEILPNAEANTPSATDVPPIKEAKPGKSKKKTPAKKTPTKVTPKVAPSAPKTRTQKVVEITAGDDRIDPGGCVHAYEVSEPVTNYWLKRASCTIPGLRARGNKEIQLLYPASLTDLSILKVPNLTKALLSSLAGWRCDPNSPGCTNKFHKAWDIRAKPNEPVHASATGTVIEKYWDGAPSSFPKDVQGCGNTLTIQLENRPDVRVTYCHLSSYASGLKKGDHVTRSEIIGYAGSTGNATGTCIHTQVEMKTPPPGCQLVSNRNLVNPFCVDWDFIYKP